ncbi:NTE family protein [Antricoccus suffuscus]|uniref:NTE family protein n=1 Tax=Antricoccus suffuscus TaxID=1629062 RepID=A0A2T0Z8U0_9ACTN|nr:patatin-like phospholipase family protein [Antricoccus suffuscus]PRZ32741.1 NTE family protein [Antricoccus suffuscus]
MSKYGDAKLKADLVLEGGGVKGIAFGGAIAVLAEAGYRFPRVVGTSAGAIAGSVVAALQEAGEPLERIVDVTNTLDLSKVRDSGRVGKALGPLHVIADGASLIFEGGLYEGAYARDWVYGVLKDLGVTTFADLRRDDPESALPLDREYSFIAVTSDLSDHRMTLLPWDYRYYGLDPDEQIVADAVRASSASPFIFEPYKLRTPNGTVTLVDGGILSNYPIGVFDRRDASARWPTFGIRLSARESVRPHSEPVTSPIGIAIAVVETAMEGTDARHIDLPSTQRRTVFVDTDAVSVFDFGITREQRDELVRAGRVAAEQFLATWDFDEWQRRYGTRPPTDAQARVSD